MNDTTPEIQDKYQRMIMALSPSDRIAMACSMFSTARSLMVAGMRDKVPEDEVRWRLLLRLYGNDLSESSLQRIKTSLKK